MRTVGPGTSSFRAAVLPVALELDAGLGQLAPQDVVAEQVRLGPQEVHGGDAPALGRGGVSRIAPPPDAVMFLAM